MINRIRLLLLCEAIAFSGAASIHFGLSFHGYEHVKAGTAESVIAGVLFAGLILSLTLARSTRIIALIVQCFALIGTLVGIFTIIIGVGPRTVPDVTFHIAIVVVLIWGLLRTNAGKFRQSDQTHDATESKDLGENEFEKELLTFQSFWGMDSGDSVSASSHLMGSGAWHMKDALILPCYLVRCSTGFRLSLCCPQYF